MVSSVGIKPVFRSMYPGSSCSFINQITMSKITNFIGIDISKDTFDVFNPKKGHEKYSNDAKGFNSFLKTLTPDSWCVMEATGCYYYQLALFLHERKIVLSVVNPVVIKRFIQMKLRKNKNDKADAKMIAQYAAEQEVFGWNPEPEYIENCRAIFTTIELYTRQLTGLKNKHHALTSRGVKLKLLFESVENQIKVVKENIKVLEKEMESLVKQNDQSLLTNLSSIPGIGKKTAILLIISTNGFKTFDNAKQVSCFFGLSPTERTSGTSIKGRSSISKAGNPLIRSHLFLCSFTAFSCNPACKSLYERIINKGKCKKVALIAVANKLLKQGYGVSKNGLPFDSSFKSKFPQEIFAFKLSS